MNKQKSIELRNALDDYIKLLEEKDSLGPPPHTDYWHQPIADKKGKVVLAINKWLKN